MPTPQFLLASTAPVTDEEVRDWLAYFRSVASARKKPPSPPPPAAVESAPSPEGDRPCVPPSTSA